jgi:WD40 repeat protein
MTTNLVESILKGHDNIVNSVCFSHDGNKLASGSCDRTIKIWDLKTYKLEHTFWHDDSVN